MGRRAGEEGRLEVPPGGAPSRSERAEAVLAHALGRWEAGHAPDLDELVREHPDLADELARLWPDWVSFGARLRRTLADGAAELDRQGALVAGLYRLLRRVEERPGSTLYEAREEVRSERARRRVGQPLFVELFEPEARLALDTDAGRALTEGLLDLESERVLGWLDYGAEVDGTRFAAFEAPEGEELEVVLHREGRLEPRRAARILADLCEALDDAHRAGLAGVDLHPGRVLLVPGSDGRERAVLVLGADSVAGGDVARARESARGAAPRERTPARSGEPALFPRPLRFLLRGGASFALTPEYAAPELCAALVERGIEVGARPARPLAAGELGVDPALADLFSLGALGVRLATGEALLPACEERGDLPALLARHAPLPAPPGAALRALLPRAARGLAPFLEACLARDPADRPRGPLAARALLREAARGALGTGRRRALAALALLALAAALGPRVARLALGGPRPWQLFAAAGGGQVAAEPLYMGPGRADVLLTFDQGGEERATPTSALRVARAADGATLSGFAARFAGPREIALAAGPDAPAGHLRERVRLEATDDPGLAFEPFTLHWLGRDAWRVAGLGFGPRLAAGGAPPCADPDGLELSAWVAGDGAGDLARVAARVGGPSGSGGADGGEWLRLARAPGDDPSGSLRFALDLAELGLKPGPASLELELRDGAGRVERAALDVHVVRTPLRAVAADVVGRRAEGEPVRLPRGEGGVHVAREDDALFALELDRPAALAWSLSVEGAPAASGRAEPARLHELELGVLLAQLDVPSGAEAALAWRADEAQRVARAQPERGRVAGEVRLSLRSARSHVACELVPPDGGEARAVAPGETAFARSGARLRVRSLAPDGLTLVRASLGASPRASLGGGEEHELRELSLAGGEAREVPLALDGEGLHRLRLAVHRADAQGRPADTPDETLVVRIAVDETPPELDLADGRAPLLWAAGAAAPVLAPRVALRGPDDAPVRALVLRLLQGGGELARAEAAGPPFELTVPDPGRDGLFALSLAGVDAAGNALAPLELALEVARSGPELVLARPMGPDGALDPSDAELAVRASDPNGVELVSCALVRGEEELPVALHAGEGDTLVGRAVLPEGWEEAAVLVEALDRRGNASLLEAGPFPLARVRRAPPPALAAERDADGARTPVAPLALVRGNAEPYVFGGRGDAEESALLAAAGRAPLAGEAGRAASWGIELAPGAVADFYLDRREVAAAELLAFVLDDAAWSDDSLRAPGARPFGAARRAELAAVLSAAAPDAPATGATFDEAFAYARWVGKRLPTLVEWELAARGGARYLAVAPEGALEGLCSGAAEWTATPWALAGERGLPDERLRARERGLAFPSDADLAAAESFWVAGGDRGGRPGDFASLDDLPRGARAADVGFRCAVDAADVALGRGGEGRLGPLALRAEEVP